MLPSSSPSASFSMARWLAQSTPQRPHPRRHPHPRPHPQRPRSVLFKFVESGTHAAMAQGRHQVLHVDVRDADMTQAGDTDRPISYPAHRSALYPEGIGKKRFTSLSIRCCEGRWLSEMNHLQALPEGTCVCVHGLGCIEGDAGELMLAMLAQFAQMERNRIRARADAGRAKARESLVVPTRKDYIITKNPSGRPVEHDAAAIAAWRQEHGVSNRYHCQAVQRIRQHRQACVCSLYSSVISRAGANTPAAPEPVLARIFQANGSLVRPLSDVLNKALALESYSPNVAAPLDRHPAC